MPLKINTIYKINKYKTYKYNLLITIFQSKDTLSALTRYVNLQPQFAMFFSIAFLWCYKSLDPKQSLCFNCLFVCMSVCQGISS